MTGMAEKSSGPWALDSFWLDETPSQAGGGADCAPPAGLSSWDAGADFTSEVESVSRLFPHLDGLTEMAAVCGGTRLALGADLPGSPADQCLMSPSDALLASPDPCLGSPPGPLRLAPSADRKETSAAGDCEVATGGRPISKMAHIPAEHTVTDKITTLIEFFEPARAQVIQTPPAEEIFVSPTLMTEQTYTLDTSPSRNVSISEASPAAAEFFTASSASISSPAGYESTAVSSPSLLDLAQSPEIDLLPASVEEDEHTRMIDQALEDLKTLESMCGITPDDTTVASASSASVAASLTDDTSATTTTAASIATSPVIKSTIATDTLKQEPIKQESIKPEPVKQESVKPEPISPEEDEVEIVAERPAPRRRRRRPPRVAVTPGAASNTQIVIVLTKEQVAGIQRSGQIVLSAAALQPSLAAAQVVSGDGDAGLKRREGKTSGRAPNKKARATSKVRSENGQAVVKSSAAVKDQSGTRLATVVKPTSTITSEASTSQIVTSQPGTSGVGALTEARKAVKRPQVIVKQESAKKARRTVKRPAASSEDPLSGWVEQKLPADSVWNLPPLEAVSGPEDHSAAIPEDLQDLLLDSGDCSGAVPAPPDAADCLLDELFSGSVRENPGLFDGAPSAGEVTKPALFVPERQQLPAAVGSAQPVLLGPAGGFSLSPQPQQLVLDPWSPAVCRSPGYGPLSPGYSPLSPGEESPPELAPGPDWRPGPALRRPARRPRPYDKPGQPGRRLAMTEEQRRLRKKEQNKNAATRYRQKKKEEHDLVSGDQEMLEARNKFLRDRVDGLSRELDYLKQLMREVLKHKQVTA